MKTFTRLFARFEDFMSATTFAEAGEFETARDFMRKGEGPRERISRRAGKDLRTVVKTARK
jgi:hypothetical protein